LLFRRQLLNAIAKLTRQSQWNFDFWATAGAYTKFESPERTECGKRAPWVVAEDGREFLPRASGQPSCLPVRATFASPVPRVRWLDPAAKNLFPLPDFRT
jgi:hypothetical protein